MSIGLNTGMASIWPDLAQIAEIRIADLSIDFSTLIPTPALIPIVTFVWVLTLKLDKKSVRQ
jgi:hypothetical protein